MGPPRGGKGSKGRLSVVWEQLRFGWEERRPVMVRIHFIVVMIRWTGLARSLALPHVDPCGALGAGLEVRTCSV